VLVRWLAIPVSLLAAILAVGCGGSAEDRSPTLQAPSTRAIAGDWTGRLIQTGLPPFRIAVAINPRAGGAVAYTGIRCGGIWTAISGDPPATYVFREGIKFGSGGKCKGTGTVSLKRDGQRLDYVFHGGGVTSRGILSRTTPRALNRVFRQIGAGLLPG
jgi:hypothetical protein